MAAVELDAVTFRYPGSQGETLEALTLVVADRSTHALLGASGAGKTTVLNLLSGFLQPTSGRVVLGGKDVSRIAPAARNVTQVFQFPVLYPAMTASENLAFPLRNRAWRKEATATRVREIARELDIESLLPARIGELTLFERQLVAIGRALVRPDVGLVLLDEPLTAVQPELKWRLRRTLRRVQADLGVTMVYVTHDQTEALTFASAVSVMHDGRVLQTGSPSQVHDSPAHEYVGYFIGSPGMSFIDVQVRDGRVQGTGVEIADTAVPDGPYRLGFRADWAVLGQAGMPVELVGFRPDGMIDDVPVGVVSLTIGGVRAHVRHAGELPAARSRLMLHRHVLFREGLRVA